MKENLYPFAAKKAESAGNIHTIISVSNINPTAFVLRIERKGLTFIPGQYISIGMPGKGDKREYSIFSASDADFLEVLIREVEDGTVSRQLRKLGPGDPIEIEGPFGFFTIPDDKLKSAEFIFIATGTGVSPFHSIIASNAPANFRLIHGVRLAEDALLHGKGLAGRYIVCSSRDESGHFRGRVSEWLKQNPVSPGTLCYLCGNCEMIYDCFDILESQGISPEDLHAEVYF